MLLRYQKSKMYTIDFHFNNDQLTIENKQTQKNYDSIVINMYYIHQVSCFCVCCVCVCVCVCVCIVFFFCFVLIKL